MSFSSSSTSRHQPLFRKEILTWQFDTGFVSRFSYIRSAVFLRSTYTSKISLMGHLKVWQESQDTHINKSSDTAFLIHTYTFSCKKFTVDHLCNLQVESVWVV